MATAAARYNPPLAGGGLEVGTTTVTGGVADAVLHERGGIVRSDADITFDHDMGTAGALSVGAAAFDASTVFGGGVDALIQVQARHNGFGGFMARNLGTGGNGNGSGNATGYLWQTPGVSGFAQAVLYGISVTAKFFGAVRADKLALRAQVPINIGTDTTHDLTLGVNGAHGTDATAARDTVTLRGDGSGVASRRGIATEYRTVSASAAIVAGEGAVLVDNTTGANVDITMPASTALPDGFEFQLSTTSNTDATNTVTIVAGGSDTLDARITACATSTASRRIKLHKGTSRWYLIGITG